MGKIKRNRDQTRGKENTTHIKTHLETVNKNNLRKNPYTFNTIAFVHRPCVRFKQCVCVCAHKTWAYTFIFFHPFVNKNEWKKSEPKIN